jgi:tRNA (guanine-N7-)-methyltransferase
MRLRNVKGSRERIEACPFTLNEDDGSALYTNKGKWNEIFKNDNPIHIEIGMGKGQFITELALKNPNINYIGIEKFSSVLIRAIEKRELKENEGVNLSNLLFIRMDAEHLPDVFDQGEIGFIYLNFSDPWPKDRHAKRRLTSDRFLERYTHILVPEGEITFKTDNNDLFDYSVEMAKECGWTILALTRDLHHSEYNEGNIMTEYEKKFSGLGQKINMMKIKQ